MDDNRTEEQTGSTASVLVADPDQRDWDAEHERLVAERAARRQERLDALAPAAPVVPTAGSTASEALVLERAAQPLEPAEPVVETVVKRNTDRFLPSLGLFLLRLVTAAIMGVHGLNKLLDLPAATEAMAQTVLPEPSIMAIVVGAAEVGIAIALVFGLLTRLAGLGIALIAGGALAFVLWGPWSPFIAGKPGFIGELELLLAAVGLLFLTVGAGGWSIDRGFRARRDR